MKIIYSFIIFSASLFFPVEGAIYSQNSETIANTYPKGYYSHPRNLRSTYNRYYYYKPYAQYNKGYQYYQTYPRYQYYFNDPYWYYYERAPGVYYYFRV